MIEFLIGAVAVVIGGPTILWLLGANAVDKTIDNLHDDIRDGDHYYDDGRIDEYDGHHTP
jgi:hypothetical protein